LWTPIDKHPYQRRVRTSSLKKNANFVQASCTLARPKNKEWLKKKNTFWDMVFEDYNKNRVFERLARLLET
jgi:hypothetical protein